MPFTQYHLLITCTKCNKQYIGKTKNSLRTRFTSHRFDINNDRGTSVANHFNLDDHTSQHVNIIAIDQLPGSDNISLLNKETYWIHYRTTWHQHQGARIFPHLYSLQVMSPCSPPFTPSHAFLYAFLSHSCT
ncbi:hypothetical protein ElyMa_006158200 [Elysia marginata]|uniref:GIY-YIG domain-containing protein n=1 Tax=Elysia marginata TaxID=1093978 RepID=A0AAV4H2I0_9GAST|nr:hypothetical protein ElyMa_006158200 [Elysia marginata]